MAKHIGFQTTITPLAIALSATFMVVACGSAGNDKTLITTAKPTELETKLSTCATTKLSGQLKTVEGTPRNVCRVDSEGLVKEVSLRPTFGAYKNKDRIALLQVLAVRLDGKSSVMPLLNENEETFTKRLRREKDVRIFLRQVCQPMVEGILARSGIASRLIFRSKKIGDLPAQASGAGSNSSQGNDGETDDSDSLISNLTIATTAQPSSPPPAVSPQPRSGQNKASNNQTGAPKESPVRMSPSEYHAILDLVSGPDGQIKIRDELDPVLSGSIGLTPGVAPTVEQKHFCSQLAVRIIENYGLAEGRDCKARGRVVGKCAVEGEGGKCVLEKFAEIDSELIAEPKTLAQTNPETTKVDSQVAPEVSQEVMAMTLGSEVTSSKPVSDDTDPATGLMKPGRTTDDMNTVKLSRKELAEVLNPVCGPIEDSSQIKK